MQQRQQQQETTLPTVQSLLSLSEQFFHPQCVSFLHNNKEEEELLICGGQGNRNCYSYHIQRQQYKFICSYSENIQLYGHTVISHSFPYFSTLDHHPDRNSTAKDND